ncbi:hypothetical protein [Bacillus thuringiensis]|uniref:hypothetical protein n=1 Tax=Bacillus thuringiensis TaxID=1428 RepID=UPI0021D64B74|nr:hypothetical protein [Bacillus thuringiensis]MCU7666728.1 hypothetical protein [Bacillus thuringiensis]
MNLEEELYLNDTEMRFEIEHTEGLEIVSETDNVIDVVDTFQENNRFLRFNKESYLVNEEMIEDFGQGLKECGIIEYLQMLPKILLMTVRKIYIVSTSEHLEQLEDETGIYTFDLFNKGMYVWENGNIIISLVAHENEAESLSHQELEEEGQTDYDRNLRIDVWKTIARELFHSLQSNPLFGDDIEQGEEIVEDFCEMFFSPTYA